MDERYFKDTYDLYRPTVGFGDDTGGEQRVVIPSSATTSGLPCLFFPAPGRLAPGGLGVEMHFDAQMRIPSGQTLNPADSSGQPDYVKVGGSMYVVQACWDAAGRSDHKRALLRQQGT